MISGVGIDVAVILAVAVGFGNFFFLRNNFSVLHGGGEWERSKTFHFWVSLMHILANHTSQRYTKMYYVYYNALVGMQCQLF
jgi:hypothetical protein